MIKYLATFKRARYHQIDKMRPSLDAAVEIVLEMESRFKGNIFLTGSRFFCQHQLTEWDDLDYFMASTEDAKKWLEDKGFTETTLDRCTDMSVDAVFTYIDEDIRYTDVFLIKPNMMVAKRSAQQRILDSVNNQSLTYSKVNWMTWEALLSTELGVISTPTENPLMKLLKKFLT